MPIPNFGGTGWCQNLAHSDYLHTLSDNCTEPETLQERVDEMKEAAQAGKIEGLADKIDALREEAAKKAFEKIIQGYKLPDYKRK